ncbi:tRNA(m5U54)methyltransferase [Pleurotus ostreatus]|nr:tRNA(m5U54)methyltransferase [Pleurotus ostreatus]
MADPESATTGQARAHPSKELDFGRKKPRLADVDTPKKQVSKHKKSRAARKRDLNPEPYSPDDVLHRDILQMIGKEVVDKALVDGSAKNSPLQFHDEVELEILSISSGVSQVMVWRWPPLRIPLGLLSFRSVCQGKKCARKSTEVD